MEHRLREHGEAKRNKVRSAGRPSELSERLERLVMPSLFVFVRITVDPKLFSVERIRNTDNFNLEPFFGIPR